MKNTKNKNSGIIALATIILISAIILEIGLVTAFVVYTLNNINYGARLSSEALLASQSGVDDALLRLSRDKSANLNYSLSVGTRIATIILVSLPGMPITITSEGIALNKHRKLQVIFDVDPITGIVRIVSKKELAF